MSWWAGLVTDWHWSWPRKFEKILNGPRKFIEQSRACHQGSRSQKRLRIGMPNHKEECNVLVGWACHLITERHVQVESVEGFLGPKLGSG